MVVAVGLGLGSRGGGGEAFRETVGWGVRMRSCGWLGWDDECDLQSWTFYGYQSRDLGYIYYSTYIVSHHIT